MDELIARLIIKRLHARKRARYKQLTFTLATHERGKEVNRLDGIHKNKNQKQSTDNVFARRTPHVRVSSLSTIPRKPHTR